MADLQRLDQTVSALDGDATTTLSQIRQLEDSLIGRDWRTATERYKVQALVIRLERLRWRIEDSNTDESPQR